MPAHERRAIFGLMVGNEGKTRIPIYQVYAQAGFDPDRDMLQAPIIPREAGGEGLGPDMWRTGAVGGSWQGGGVVIDWDLKTNLEGLYAAGGAVFGCGAHSSAATSGRYAGKKAATYALTTSELEIDRGQVEKEMTRVYAPLEQNKPNLGWKELNIGICRVMQDYCGQYKNEETLQAGLRLLQELRESEATHVYAANPHELARIVECQSIITAGEAVMHASLARRSSSDFLNFFRLDYPLVDPPEWHKLLPIKLVDDKVTVDELPLDYHLQPPYAPTYEENYQRHSEF
jgi:succinate dehydrogenase/fumarate reductase flavoprotein subunit